MRPVTLFTGQWADLTLKPFAIKPANLNTTDWNLPAGVITWK